MKEFAKEFYTSPQWRHCRDAYMNSVGMMCEICKESGAIEKADIVHHKIHITPDNINNPDITLNHLNLQALCRHHHMLVHSTKVRRYVVDSNGNVIDK